MTYRQVIYRLLTVLLLPATAAIAADYAFPAAKTFPVQSGLADVFIGPDGKRIQARQDWPAQRRYLKAMMERYQYGRMPPSPEKFDMSRQESVEILGGRAVRERWTLTLSRNGKTASIRVGVVRPTRAGSFPVVVKNDTWIFEVSDIENPRSRQQYIDQGRPQVDLDLFEEAVKRGYAIVKFNRGDVAQDTPDNRGTGVFTLYPEPEYDWGTIAAWAWIYQPMIDWLEGQPWADASKVAVTGHSRGGKTALCAGIYDERIAVTAPSASGSGGAGSWRYFTEGGRQQDVEDMMGSQPHWFTERLTSFKGLDERLPFGSHTAKALIAPRGLFNTNGRDDALANPVGTQASFEAAQVVFDWLEAGENQGLHWRPGGHMQGLEDWLALLDFCDRYYFGKKSSRDLAEMPNPGQTKRFDWAAPKR